MYGYNVVVTDKWDKSVDVEMCSEGVCYSAPVEFGSINPNGVIYDVKVLYPKYNKAENPYVILTRRESLEIAGAEGKDYDVNEDGIWNTYDLCMMRRQLASSEN